VILTLLQVLDIFDNLDLMRRTMVLTDAATALRVSEIPALMWKDLDFVAQLIRVRRAYVYAVLELRNRRRRRPRFRCILCWRHIYWLGVRKPSMPPTKTWFSRVFAPRAPSLPRPTCWLPINCAWALKKAGVVAPPRTFGFHTFRRTLASVLVKMKVDVKTVQDILRHQNLKTTLEIYAKSMSEHRLLAPGMSLELLFSHKKPQLLDGVVLQR
jgi:integrase